MMGMECASERHQKEEVESMNIRVLQDRTRAGVEANKNLQDKVERHQARHENKNFPQVSSPPFGADDSPPFFGPLVKPAAASPLLAKPRPRPRPMGPPRE
jgi:hypothetical protein